MTRNPRSPWDVPDDPVGVVEGRSPVNGGDDRDDKPRREPTLARDGYTVLSRRPDCARPGEIMSNERANRREQFDDEYRQMRSLNGPYETSED